MTARNTLPRVATTIRWIARIVAAFLALWNGAYILFATLMIMAAREELFPKMTCAFLALGLLIAGLVASWRWETLGSVVIVGGVLAYRAAEHSRLGYVARPWYASPALVAAALLLTSSALHWWMRRHPQQPPPDSVHP